MKGLRQVSKAINALIEIDLLKTTNLLEGIFFKTKEFEFAYYINIIVDKRILGLENTENEHLVPDYITFLFILDTSYPEMPPKVLAKTNVISLFLLFHSLAYLILWMGVTFSQR